MISVQLSLKIYEFLSKVEKVLCEIVKSRLLLKILLYSLAQWILMGVCIFISLYAAHISLPLYLSFIIMGLIVAAITLPSIPGNIGVIEVCFILVLTVVNIDVNQAMAAGLFYHLILYISVTMSGFFCVKLINFPKNIELKNYEKI